MSGRGRGRGRNAGGGGRAGGRSSDTASETESVVESSTCFTDSTTAQDIERLRQMAIRELSDDDGSVSTGDGAKHLPPHACSYCGYHETNSVCRCNVCKKWFCNGRGNLNASHIVMHMLLSKHKEVSAHPENNLGDDVMECYVCTGRNIFLLGFVPSKQDHVAVLICREPCLHSGTLRDLQWDPDAWLPLVEGRQLLSWIADAPKPKQMKGCRSITLKQAQQLEEARKTNADATLDDVMRADATAAGAQFAPIPNYFRNGSHYEEIFGPLVIAERDQCQSLNEQFVAADIQISWRTNVNKKIEGTFPFTVDDNLINVGGVISLSHEQQRFQSDAVVIAVEHNNISGNTIRCELRSAKAMPTFSNGFTMRLIFNDISYKRMLEAMRAMVSDETSLSAHLYRSLLGQPTNTITLESTMPKALSAPNLAVLNSSQEKAVAAVLQRPLSLIQGPPGTGKTTTIATIVYHLVQMYDSQVLVCAPSNVAVDELADRISRTGLSVVRVLARGREDVACQVEHLCLHQQVKQLAEKSPANSLLRKLHTLREEVGTLKDEDFRKYKMLVERAEKDILSEADVICTTCSAAADHRLSTFRLQHVVIDESTQACEPETLVPLVMGARQVVLVGDHCQLGPVVFLRAANGAGYGRSLFERLAKGGHKPHRLEIQYRMHPFLSQFSSNCFYEGTLQNGVSAEDRDSKDIFPWPNPNKPLFFYNSNAAEEMGSNGTSVLNRTESAIAEKLITCLIANGARAEEVGVITPYEAQRIYLSNYLARSGPLGADAYRRVEVASVDSFQGREKDFIVLSCVRSNDNRAIGFLKDWRRLNVALTRARRGVMVIGNARMLAHHPLWHNFLTHCMHNGLIVDGSIKDLRPLAVTLPKPRLTAVDMQMALALQAQESPMQSLIAQAPMYAVSAATEDGYSVSHASTPFIDTDYVPGRAGGHYNMHAASSYATSDTVSVDFNA